MALVATFRRHYGVSAWNIGIGHDLSWAEAVDLLDAALEDSSTEIFAAVASWDYPLSMAEMLAVIGDFGKDAEKVLPFRASSSPQVSEAETAAAHEELLAEIIFT